MRALVCNAYGSPDELVVEEWPDPQPGPGEVVVDVRAAGLNFPDVLSIAGKYQDKTPPPFVPGNEASGVVSAIGDGVDAFALGDEVVAIPRGGAFAEKLRVNATLLAPLPPALSFNDAAGFGVVFGTSYHALKQCARLEADETVLVLGAAGGVGIAAVELAKAMGATVIAAASSAEKLEFTRAAGADHTINYNERPLNDAAKEITDGRGVDIVYDPVGGELALQALRALAWHGRYLVVGFASGEIPAFPGNIALLKEASIVGTWWGTWVQRHPDEHRQNMAQLATWIANGTVSSKVSEVFPLEEFKIAFERITSRRALGKLVFSFDQ